MRQYNIIWADDEIDMILKTDDKLDLEKDNICILSTAHNGDELQMAMHEKINLVDAVIVDANFDATDNRPEGERVISGLRRAFELYRQYNGRERRNIPFYLYTGRKREFILNNSYFDKNDIQTLNEMFEAPGRWFEKGDPLDRMINKIKCDVDEVNTPEFRLRRKYSKELIAASLIPDAVDTLFSGLLFEFSNEPTDEEIKKSFTDLRLIFEKITDNCVNKGWIPQLGSLNTYVDLFEMREVEGFKLTKQIMPKTLCYSLNYFLGITQDGSHDKKSLQLGVRDYVRDVKNSNLYQSVLYIAMDLLLWYKCLLESNPDNLWIGTYEASGNVCAKMNGERLVYVLNGEYQIEDKGDLTDGTFISVIKSAPNKHPFDTIKKFVYKTNYIIKQLPMQKDCTEKQ